MSRISRRVALVLFVSILVPTSAALAAPVDVEPGYDLLETFPGTTLSGVPFTGVPIGSYNFGGSIDTKNIGVTDTILLRQAAATPGAVPGTAPPIPVQMVSLQLVTTTPVNLGAGLRS